MLCVVTHDNSDFRLTAKMDVPIGHKIALRDLKAGDTVFHLGLTGADWPETRAATQADPARADAAASDITVIVPVRNAQGILEECLASIARQQPAEVIVVDGGSSDATRAAAGDADQVLASSPGRARQMNIGARQASGDAHTLNLEGRLDPDWHGGTASQLVVATSVPWYKARALQAIKSPHVPARTAGCLHPKGCGLP